MNKVILLVATLFAITTSTHVAGAESKSNKKAEKKNMEYRVELKNVEAQPALVIKGKAKVTEVGPVIGGILGKIEEHLKSQKASPSGPPFTRTFSFENGVLEFESGFPVASKIIGRGEIISTELPKGAVATTVHIGSQEDSPKAYEAIQRWLQANKKKESGAPWEVYLTDPASTPPEKSKMQIFFPVK
ncbi:MAG: GyrI-like domain-containing protein [Proteobacteria bacterium]|nr:GyrI-like domain-containing protein [Pseudomonadota bacterium]